MTDANLLMYFNLFWSSESQLKFGQQSCSCHFSKYSLFLFILCVCGQKLWESCVIVPEMQSVLFSLETLFFVPRADIRQLQAFEKLSRGNEPWHLITRTSVTKTEWSWLSQTKFGEVASILSLPFSPSFGLHNTRSRIFSTESLLEYLQPYWILIRGWMCTLSYFHLCHPYQYLFILLYITSVWGN